MTFQRQIQMRLELCEKPAIRQTQTQTQTQLMMTLFFLKSSSAAQRYYWCVPEGTANLFPLL